MRAFLFGVRFLLSGRSFEGSENFAQFCTFGKNQNQEQKSKIKSQKQKAKTGYYLIATVRHTFLVE